MSTHAEQFPEPESVPHTEPVVTPSPRHRTLAKSKAGYTWIGLVIAALLGIVLLIFILQNLETARFELLFWSFTMPLGVSVLLSVIAGALVMALVGGVRIMQLRRAAKRI